MPKFVTANQLTKVNTHPQWYIQHNYHDHSEDIPSNNTDLAVMQCFSDSQSGIVPSSTCAEKHNRADRFPLKLHRLLLETQDQGLGHIVSWQVHGRSFKVHDVYLFVDKVLPLYFSHQGIRFIDNWIYMVSWRLLRGAIKGGFIMNYFFAIGTFSHGK